MVKLAAVALTFLFLYTGCTTLEEEDERGYCLDYKSAPIEEERCTPFYGSMICVIEQRTRTWCTLWSEEAKPTKPGT